MEGSRPTTGPRSCAGWNSSARRSAANWPRTARSRCSSVAWASWSIWRSASSGNSAVAAIIANLHDVVIILGFFALFQWEFSLPVLAAVLAVLGYSVNESVVIADRIRENFRKMRKASVTEIIDNAITSTISRTIITHGCTQTMVTSMLLFGGAGAALLRAGADHRHPASASTPRCWSWRRIVRWLGVRREDLVKPVKDKKQEAVV